MTANATRAATLRIASLLPSTTDICISLRLEHNIVGITHECDFPPSHPLYLSAAPLLADTGTGDEHHGGGRISNVSSGKPNTKPRALTVSQIDIHQQSQAEIDAAVKSSVFNGISLYNLNHSALTDSQPTLILTQSLCDVCAVSKSDVDQEVACNFRPGQCKVLSLEPESLEEVVETFVTVAEACGVKERGVELKAKFWEGGQQILEAASLSRSKDKPTVLFFEWLSPPFDAGHWIPDMLELSGCVSAVPWSKNTRKSVELSWQQIYDCDPDVVIVGCCGFDMSRNEEDARAARKKLEPLRAYRNNRIYASDGNLYFARPGPALREGIAILARCAYDGEAEVVRALERIAFMPKENEGWSKIAFPEESADIPDIEDLVNETYMEAHDEACLAKLDLYKDPATGYNVYTEYAHKKRGKCCGSGCRHCPYNHANVKDKTKRIQQPAFLYEGPDPDDDAVFAPLSSIPPRSHIKVLFFSGGKDSYLTIRKLVKKRQASSPFHLILLTTFDAESRIIAHQEMPIDAVLRQAQHLGIPLLAIPLRRGSGEAYVNRIEKGLNAIRQRVPDMQQMTLVFGDLHLDHIREWRDKEFSNYALEYPLWKVPYDDLMNDLEMSGVSVVLSAVTVTEGELKAGMPFTRKFWKHVEQLGMDGFGEAGEFHSIAEVWSVSREQALGL
eukprot:CAMPEP_0172322392 /NCGR_PEP_ID=MMETSP1058-20130122/45748_1 /TAXON_ID=83371 /ORGANISM="Detonula confervacea, Strain CCMP 353" /LENGTH=672 /DNA_ID=CAMNT_0013038125 /DNA_START=44 /DNA_END=2062 /DNA_ORIENTATION=+